MNTSPKKVQVRAGLQGPALLLPRIASHRILTSPVTSHRYDADMRGSKRELRPGVWELRVSLGYDPESGKRHQASKTWLRTSMSSRWNF